MKNETPTLFTEDFNYIIIFKSLRTKVLDFIEGKSHLEANQLIITLLEQAKTAIEKAVLLEAIEYGKLHSSVYNTSIYSLDEQLLLRKNVAQLTKIKISNSSAEKLPDLLLCCHKQLKQIMENRTDASMEQQCDLTLILLTGLSLATQQGKQFNEKEFFKKLDEKQVYQIANIPLYDISLKILNQFKKPSLKKLWNKISDFLLLFFNEKKLTREKDELIQRQKMITHRYQNLLTRLHDHLALKSQQDWKQQWLYGKDYFSLKFKGKSGVSVQGFFHLTQEIAPHRFVVIEDMMFDISSLLGSTYFSMEKSLEVENTLCLDANYQSGSAGATADGLGHFNSDIMNRQIQAAAYRAVKLLVRYANFYQDAASLFEDLPTLFSHVGKAVKYSFQHPEESGTACCVLTKTFSHGKNDSTKKTVVAGGTGDCMVMAWIPSTSQLIIMLNPRRYHRGTQSTPISITEKMTGEMFQRCTLTLPTECFLIRMTDGAWELLPYMVVKGFDEESKKNYFEYTLNPEFAVTLNDFARNNPQAHAAEYRAFLQKLMQTKLDANKTLLLFYHKMILEKLPHFAFSDTSSLNEFILWAKNSDKDFYELILNGLELSNYDLDDVKPLLLKDFVKTLDHINLGDDISLHVEGLAQGENSLYHDQVMSSRACKSLCVTATF